MQNRAKIVPDISPELNRLHVFCDKIRPKFIMIEISLCNSIIKQKIIYLIWKSLDLNPVYLYKFKITSCSVDFR